MSAFDMFDWPFGIRHIPGSDGHYDREEGEYVAGSTTPTAITGHKTIATRMESERWRMTPNVGDLRSGDCYFFTTSELKRNDTVEFDENAGGTVVSRYRVEAVMHRHAMMTKFVSGLTTRVSYLLREIQHDGGV